MILTMMMRRSELEKIAILVLLILTKCMSFTCNEAERRALLEFKAGLYEFTAEALSSWGEESSKSECCVWLGVKCNTKSGHVVGLDLSPATFNWTDFGGTPTLSGTLGSSLLNLPYLNYLDLSHISFSEPSIPGFLGSLGNLRYLNLSYTRIVGEVPPQLGNLSALEILDLSDIFKSVKTISDMGWVSNLLSLQSLDLSFNDMSMAKNWVNVLSDLPNLSVLRLKFSNLPHTTYNPSILHVNSSRSLAYLDLYGNDLSSSIYPWLFNHSGTLVHLDLNTCSLRGSIPEAFGDMTSLEYLDLTANFLEGIIPESLGNLNAISFLGLAWNQLEGIIPESFGNMSSLEHLDLKENLLGGEVPKSIWELCSLRNFEASNNNLSGHLRFAESLSDCAYYPLEYVDLQKNSIEGPFPDLTLYPSLISLWLQSNRLDGIVSESLGQLSKLNMLDLSENMIKVVLTEAHLLNMSSLKYLDISSNSYIVLNFSSDWIPSFQLDYIRLRSCKCGPHFPRWLRNQKSYMELDISNSGISDSIPNWFWNLSKSAVYLNLSNNQITETNQDSDTGFNVSYFNLSSLEMIPSIFVDLSSNFLKGSVPRFLIDMFVLRISKNYFSDINSLCSNTTLLSFLDISYNRLSGELPDCWLNAANLGVLVLTHNNLSGKIPSSIGFLTQISVLHLSYNRLSGGIPWSLKNCTQLMVLDVGENILSGHVPSWIGTSFLNLAILVLRSNRFNGSVPSELCHLENLQILDLSSNDLTSSISRCVGYFEAMKQTGDESIIFGPEAVFLLWKGAVSEFINSQLLRSIDLSSNKLAGEIPKEITSLIGLVSLNLSRNFFNWKIPRDVGRLKSLDTLDLSNNFLSGSIPRSLSEVDRLSILDLSNNNLSGKIPTGPQLQNRDSSAYSGNPKLCGEPLSIKCGRKGRSIATKATEPDQARHEDDGEFITNGFYISVALGFIVGLCGAFWRLIPEMFRECRRFKL